MTDRRFRRAATLLGIMVVAGCGNPAAPAATVGAGSSTPQPTAAPTPTEAGAIVIEDAGVDVALAPGHYASRVFRPAVELQLPAGWLRRSATRANGLAIGSASSDIDFAITHLDFAQCGETLLAHPKAAAAAELVAKATVLHPTAGQTTIDGASVPSVDLPGGGAGSGGEIDPANGCIFTTGDAAYPAEGAWIVLTTSEAGRLAFLDVGDVTVLVIGRSPTMGLDAVLAAVEPLLAGVQFPQ
jgi:hypothetical protein